MYSQSYLQIPGPTNIPKAILVELSNNAINHRSSEFASIVKFIIKELKDVFQTKNDILIYPSSGSGALEASIVNTLSVNDSVLAVNMGVFSQRYGQIAAAYGANVSFIDVEWGNALDPKVLKKKLEEDKNKQIKAVLLTHNETSTSVTNEIKPLVDVIKEIKHPALILLDAVSSLAIEKLPTDELGIDIVVTGSQKGLMLPGGLGILSVSKNAWKAHRSSNMPKWYWDFTPLREKMKKGEMPYTPVISHFFALKKSLEIIKEEGLENVINRHEINARAFRSSMEAMHLKLFVAEEKQQSNAVTAVYMPEGISYNVFARTLEDSFNVVIGGGLKHLAGKIFRVGHLGMLQATEVLAIVNAIEMTFSKLGYSVCLGTAAAAANNKYLSRM